MADQFFDCAGFFGRTKSFPDTAGLNPWPGYRHTSPALEISIFARILQNFVSKYAKINTGIKVAA